jgi:ribonuclease HII
MKLSLSDRINFDLEQIKNCDWLIGLDEVGWGCIAGDLVIGAVAIHKSLLSNFPSDKDLNKIRDSKKLSSKIREEINNKAYSFDFNQKLFISLGQSSIEYINTHGLALAYDEALRQIIEKLKSKIDLNKTMLLLDGSRTPGFLKSYQIEKNIVVKGDDASLSIGLASIVAKQYRDKLMDKLHNQYPMYNWEKNKGYGTAEHVAALKEFGLCPIHRLKGATSILS